jgi:hypothetical protein
MRRFARCLLRKRRLKDLKDLRPCVPVDVLDIYRALSCFAYVYVIVNR